MWILRSAQRGTRSPVEENHRGPLRCARWLIRSSVFLLAAGVLLAQHTYTAADIEDGGRLFRGTCVTCHGIDGDLVPGVDLMHSKFRRASSDDGLVEIIRKGIAGTAMPPNSFTELQAGTIVAYLRSMAATAGTGVSSSGDAARGKAIFEGKGDCLSCHRVQAAGSRVGPDLTDIGALRRANQPETSLTEPSSGNSR
jgi:mono/diheme cytochrome c family protein